jgi:hypothetical protein
MLVGFKNTIVCKDRNKSRDDVRKTRDAILDRCIKYQLTTDMESSQPPCPFCNSSTIFGSDKILTISPGLIL